MLSGQTKLVQIQYQDSFVFLFPERIKDFNTKKISPDILKHLFRKPQIRQNRAIKPPTF